jgi:hypothetical protein
MSSPHPRPGTLALIAAGVGALVALVLGFLTFGAQATVAPDRVPVAVSVPGTGPLHTVAEQISGQNSRQLAWRLTSPGEARKLLADKEVYGVLELGAGPSATVVVSGAVNPSGTQLAQQALTGAAQALAATSAQANPGGPPVAVKVETVNPVSVAGRIAPLAASALAWVGCLVASAVLMLATRWTGTIPGAGARLAQVFGAGVLITAVIAGFLKLWDSALPLGWDVLGFVFLAATGFAALQAGLLRVLGVGAMAILGPLYLVAPAVAGQVPELLNPAYRALLWSWTPFRFSTEGLRSFLQGTPDAPDVAAGIWVLTAMLVAGLIVVIWPYRSTGEKTETHAPDGVVEVGVH